MKNDKSKVNYDIRLVQELKVASINSLTISFYCKLSIRSLALQLCIFKLIKSASFPKQFESSILTLQLQLGKKDNFRVSLPSSVLPLFWNGCRTSSTPYLIQEARTNSWGLQPHKPPQLKALHLQLRLWVLRTTLLQLITMEMCQLDTKHNTFALVAPKPAGGRNGISYILHSSEPDLD